MRTRVYITYPLVLIIAANSVGLRGIAPHFADGNKLVAAVHPRTAGVQAGGTGQ